MKYLKTFLLFYLFGFSQFSSAKTEIDTITNWQIYKDSKVLFRSNERECYKLTGVLKKNDDFKSLKIVFFRDTKSYGKQKITLSKGEKVLIQCDYENSDELEISKSKIQNLFEKTKVDLTIMYYDKREPKGILLGYLRLEN
ncbi:hypothetical protein HNP37_004682 [Flavobacterium nitrogenifigens]|uniref:Lipocalin-like domain-containing protein n=2 Tax=Flavobacterium TaxID=237 RepID=A0A7W7J2V0_9FLAO|nr:MULTISPECIES: hypothetical protein [Flavobacterium]MBB4804585.1 hypothetical protein [Flavobacterium nitrogenifigens]MBB6389544.1 hypothetical protein [Flavobacterium notoginsengisoli]